MDTQPACSFCGKTKSQVTHMIAGTGKVGPGPAKAWICDQYFDLAVEMVKELREASR